MTSSHVDPCGSPELSPKYEGGRCPIWRNTGFADSLRCRRVQVQLVVNTRLTCRIDPAGLMILASIAPTHPCEMVYLGSTLPISYQQERDVAAGADVDPLRPRLGRSGVGRTFESETGREAVPKNLRSEVQSTK